MKTLVSLIFLIIPVCLMAQVTPTNKEWKINEIYISDADTRYGLFLELHNASSPKGQPYDYFLSTSKKDPYQIRLRKSWKFYPDQRQRGYRTYRVSVLRFKRKSAKLYAHPDSLFLFRRVQNEFQLTDRFPIIWSDSLSVGRCGDKICYFNIPTPGRENKNVRPIQYIPRRNYRVSFLPGASSANNVDLPHIGYYPSMIVKLQKVVNRRFFYTGTSAAIFFQGYRLGGGMYRLQADTSFYKNLFREAKGHNYSVGFWATKDVGLFITPRLDISCGAGLIFYTFQQNIEYVTEIGDGKTIKDHVKEKDTIEPYGLPVVTFNAGLNYQLTPKCKIEFFHNIFFRTLSHGTTVYNKTFNLGLSYSFHQKGRGYKEGAGIFKYLF
jgi:hypothetical protein